MSLKLLTDCLSCQLPLDMACTRYLGYLAKYFATIFYIRSTQHSNSNSGHIDKGVAVIVHVCVCVCVLLIFIWILTVSYILCIHMYLSIYVYLVAFALYQANFIWNWTCFCATKLYSQSILIAFVEKEKEGRREKENCFGLLLPPKTCAVLISGSQMEHRN